MWLQLIHRIARRGRLPAGAAASAALLAVACSTGGGSSEAPASVAAAAPAEKNTSEECRLPTVTDAGTDPGTDDGAAQDATSPGTGARGGKVLVVGGALADSSPIWPRTIAEGGGVTGVHFLVITAATESAVGNFAYYQDVLHRLYGVSLDNVRQAHIAALDDPASKFVNESSWSENGDDDTEVASVRDWATVVWFAGGDQAHLATTFMRPDGSDRKVTAAIRDKLAAGKLLVAGTSAGAAVMSDPMIGEGDPYKSWLYTPVYSKFYPRAEGSDGFNAENAVLLDKGLGFLGRHHVMVDTHWFQRGRFPRTIRAVDFASGAAALDPLMKVGLGIGESSALLIDEATGTAEVLGEVDSSFVGVVDLTDATTSGNVNPYSGEGIRVGYLSVRDRIKLPTEDSPRVTFLPEASKHRYLPCNGARGLAPLAGDMFTPSGFRSALEDLLDGAFDDAAGLCHVEGFGSRLAPGSRSVGGGSFAVQGFFFRFTTDARTKEYWSRTWGWEVENALMRFGSGSGTYTPPF
jgi:cyanophycinase